MIQHLLTIKLKNKTLTQYIVTHIVTHTLGYDTSNRNSNLQINTV